MVEGTKTKRMSKTSKTGAEVPQEENPKQLSKDARQRIAEVAYALYEQRGRREGYALEDWLDAESLVNEQIYEAP